VRYPDRAFCDASLAERRFNCTIPAQSYQFALGSQRLLSTRNSLKVASFC
jgi:hypothetical protein